MPQFSRHSWFGRWRAMLSSPRFKLALTLVVGMVALFVASDALARAGGGSSYSGSRSSGGSWGGGSGSSGGGGGELLVLAVRLILWLCIEQPIIGIPLVICIAIHVIRKSKSNERRDGTWSTQTQGRGDSGQALRVTMLRDKFQMLRQSDPNFSRALFEDFVYLLYAQLQRARARPHPAMSAYCSPDVLNALTDRAISEVRGVIIGGMRILDIHGMGGPRLAVDVRIESNVVEVSAETGAEQRYYLVQRLRLMRDASAKSRPAERARVLDCPNCGAPFDAIRGSSCTYCGQELSQGRFDWFVTNLATDQRDRRGPLLTEDVPEVGTDLPTLRTPSAQTDFAALIQRDPSLNWDLFAARVRDIWSHFQKGWSERDIHQFRPYLSDNLFQSMVYWIDLYRAQKCRNVNENGGVTRLVLVDVTSDATYDAITVRLFATGLDYTISDDGKLLSGSKTRPREYSEYWTLIRGRACQTSPRDSTKCPNCGGPLEISMTGNCAYCQAKVTSGNFDWVLSRIEQDESYGG